MDPQAMLLQILADLDDAKTEEAARAAECLLTWLEFDGLPPQCDDLSMESRTIIIDLFCRSVMQIHYEVRGWPSPESN